MDYTLEDEITCPYCGHKDPDSWEAFDELEGTIDGYECGSCEKPFSVDKVVFINYTSRPIEEELPSPEGVKE